jgi:tripartite-type tricarboxylate transporter receptor subunit TctC
VQMLIDPLPSSKSASNQGRVRALAVTSLERSEMWPELPTVSESGLPGYSATVWFGLFAPAGTTMDIVEKISADVRAVLGSKNTREQLLKRNAIPTLEEFKKKVNAEFSSWEKVAKDAGLKFD